MSVSIKTASEIEKMRHACHLLEQVHDELGKAILSGYVHLGNRQTG